MNFHNLYDTEKDVTYEHLRRKEVIARTGAKNLNIGSYVDTGNMIFSRYKIEVDERIFEDDSRIDNGYFPQWLLKAWDDTVTELRRKLCLSK